MKSRFCSSAVSRRRRPCHELSSQLRSEEVNRIFGAKHGRRITVLTQSLPLKSGPGNFGANAQEGGFINSWLGLVVVVLKRDQ